MQIPVMSCHLILMWHEWNVKAGDIMVTSVCIICEPSDVMLKSFSHGGKPKPKPFLGKPNPSPHQVHLHE